MSEKKRTFLVELAVAAWTLLLVAAWMLLLVLLPISGIVLLVRLLAG